ncbi:phosphatase PAP2 family protein [Aureimonas sp. AU12]|uniref:phosphatase PAP2 family protein n=1 Tax=Aureimonas sp. AU12 TaxID=1638161 RepID=UPI000783E48A|nr:phosphatase PAP2 family protein [Aureimonas sp. AU12]
MTQGTTSPQADPETSDLEKADVEAGAKAARNRNRPLVRLAGTLSEIADQPQLAVVCGLTILAGLLRRDSRLAATGVRMLAAHGLATFAKGWIKDRVNRTRPGVAVEENRYEMRPGTSEDGRDRSFPSGHTAGAVAAAASLIPHYPAASVPAFGLAAAIAAIQVPRGHHYPGDLAAGLAIGLVAAGTVDLGIRLASAIVARR